MSEMTELVNLFFELLIYGLVPVLICIAGVGLLIGLLKGMTNIRDESLSYCLKTLAFISLSYVYIPSFVSKIKEFFEYIY